MCVCSICIYVYAGSIWDICLWRSQKSSQESCIFFSCLLFRSRIENVSNRLCAVNNKPCCLDCWGRCYSKLGHPWLCAHWHTQMSNDNAVNCLTGSAKMMTKSKLSGWDMNRGFLDFKGKLFESFWCYKMFSMFSVVTQLRHMKGFGLLKKRGLLSVTEVFLLWTERVLLDWKSKDQSAWQFNQKKQDNQSSLYNHYRKVQNAHFASFSQST